MGDPFGIGPEVIVKSLADRALRRSARFVIVGLHAPMAAAAERAGIEPFWWRVRSGTNLLSTATAHDVVVLEDDDRTGTDWMSPHKAVGPTKAGGEMSFKWVDDAISAALEKHPDGLIADAIVTAPISKEAWALAGKSRWPGHTELLAERFKAERSRMMFFAPGLRVVLATTHIPLMEIRSVLNIGRVFDTIELGAQGCRLDGVANPRIAVCGLNPHAGEHGLMGDEEQRIIEPAIRAAQASGIDVKGPFPGDTIFRAAIAGKFDLVVAMYHDQGLIPVKLLAFDRAVNATIGLPVIRTSPDHGTAYDIAGKNLADPGSMKAALECAVRMAGAINPRT